MEDAEPVQFKTLSISCVYDARCLYSRENSSL